MKNNIISIKKLFPLKNHLSFLLVMLSSFLYCSEAWANDTTPPSKEVSVKNQDFPPEHFFDLKEKTFNKEVVNFNKGWLGIYMENQKGKGVRVGGMIEGSPAQICGLQKGDVITKINGKALDTNKDSTLIQFKKAMEEVGKHNIAILTVLRNNVEIEFRPKLIPKLIPKLLDITNEQDQHQTTPTYSFVVNNVKGNAKERDVNETKSFFKFILKDEDFRDKFMKTTQRIGEEAYAREGYHDLSNSNEFRLSLIDYLMSHPLEVPYYSEMIHDHFTNKSLLQAFAFAAELLDLNPNLPSQTDKMSESENGPTISNESLQKGNSNNTPQELIENILHTIIKSLELRKASLNKLTKEELSFLYENSHKMRIDTDSAEADTIKHFLKTVLKVDLAKLIKSSIMIIESIPLERLQSINPETLKFNPFNLSNSKILVNNSIMTNQDNERRESVKIQEAGFGGDVLFVQEIRGIGKVVIGGPGTTYYYDDAAFIIDIGGDDFYFNNAGASRPEAPISVCIDLSGNDTYTSRTDYSQGAARFGTGILLDLGGDDKYMGNKFCQGFGLFGIGLLYDKNGEDSYNAEFLCQGGGLFGIGFLRDIEGNDVYFSRKLSQGIGLTKGIGGLIDITGNDMYFAGGKYPDHRDPERSFLSLAQGFASGIRPNDMIAGASGGIGALIDLKGNDTYHGDYFAQGSSYYFSLGMLYDKSGFDRYYAGRYSQGAGIHSAIGILKDYEGDDFYHAYYGVSQACGHDTGIGYLIDLKGNDFYKSNTMSQGVSNAKSFGALFDFGGNDQYIAGGGSQGYSYPPTNEPIPGIGILCDIGGDSDVFNKKVKNDTLLYQNYAGVLMNKRN